MSRADNIRSRIDGKYEKTPGYLIYDVTQAVGQEMDDADLTITETNAKLNADNLTGGELDRFVKQRKGVERKAATYATGTVTVTGNGTVAAGDIFETENGVQFEATADVSVQESAEVPVQAKVAGNVGVVGAGTITQMPITIAGIVRCENTAATEDGYDAETDDALRERYYLALRTPTSSGNKTAYRNWALEVSGVGDAQIYPLGHGDGTVDVVIINDQMLPASTSLVGDVQNYIDPNSEGKGLGTAPIGAKCYVSSAAKTDINVAGKITLQSGAESAAVEAAIKKSVADYLAGIAFSGTAVSYAHIAARITAATGVIDVENLKINNGTANIQIEERYVAVLGAVTMTYA